MTLDEAIGIYERRANTHEREAEYHRPLGYSHEAIANVAEMDAREERQIAKWLKELKERRADRKTEPQTDCGDFADRLAYERGVKHAWEVAQKVFDSTVTFYEAEDVAKQIAKTEPQTCNNCDQQRCDKCVTEIGKDEQTE